MQVQLKGPKCSLFAYALLDDGSTLSLIDRDVARRIGATGPSSDLRLSGIGVSEIVHRDSERVTIEVYSPQNRSTHTISNARTIKNLSLPKQSLHMGDSFKWSHLQGINFPEYENAKPALLIGQDNWDLILTLEARKGGRKAPVASRTVLGWVVHGYVATSRVIPHGIFLNKERYLEPLSEREEDEEPALHELVKSSFQIDVIGVSNITRKKATDKRAEQLLETHTVQVGKAWETCLLWKNDNVTLPSNKDYAKRRLKTIERKIKRDPEFGRLYRQQVENLFEQGYARKVEENEPVGDRVWYLPHFGVTNVKKPGKLRLVFDAAARTAGVSLNDCLLAGPDLLNDLLGVLMRFRQNQVAFVADIKEMFLRVRVRSEDQQSLRFLWREKDTDLEPKTYCMTSLIFGAASSPCTALYVKNRNAQVFTKKYPQAVDAIIRKHYMDDYLDSVGTKEEAKRLIHEVMHIHRQGGFKLRGWACNIKSVLQDIQPDDLAAATVKLSFDQPVERVLGLKWNHENDTFTFDVDLAKIPDKIINGTCIPTKREMLRVIMSLFDPQGFLAPFTVQGRMLLQEVWRSGIKWDDQLQDAEYKKWKAWTSDLQLLYHCAIPRCYMDGTLGVEEVELHTFCDASERAYAAVSYWRTKYTDGHVAVSFIASKSRVAPLKPLSIPRLELQAALLGSRLARYIGEEHDYPISKRVFWTDSQTVLRWIKCDPRSYKMFVAHRLGEIDELTDTHEWKWVPTAHNPADDATRSTPDALVASGRWFRGPEYLKKGKGDWDLDQAEATPQDVMEELRIQPVNICTEGESFSLPDIKRYSSWHRLIRGTACVFYAIEVFKKKSRRGITMDHLTRAEEIWSKQVQADSFAAEMQALRLGNKLPRNTRLRCLTPVFDSRGILRIAGRMVAAEGIAKSAKNPVILDGRHPYTKLLVYHYHQHAGHGRTEMVINEIRQQYWIVHLRPTVRSVASRCLRCRIQRAQPEVPRMGDLPASRLAHHHRPFTYTGIDYFGPMEITVARRKEKRWGVLFTCLTTRAVHLEVTSSLSTDSAIMALRRMMARRGCPTAIYSDNGTNFVGANAELKRALHELNTERLSQFTINRGIDWRFIPPAAPHMGGSWEILVKCVKKCLKSTLKEISPREETLLTFMAEAEHSVNSRPLTHVSVDPRDAEALTPNHFLIGASSGVPIPGRFSDTDLNCRKQWRIAQRLADSFWSRWVKEYAPTVLYRPKWNNETEALKVGDVVVISDNALPRNVWPKGIVTKTYPGTDGRVRVADVKTQKGVFKRPLVKIVRLPVKNEGTEDF